MKKVFIALIIAITIILNTGPSPLATSKNNVSRQILVAFGTESTLKSRRAAVEKIGAKTLKTMRLDDMRLRLIYVNKGKEAVALKNLKNNPNVIAADYNGVVKTAWVPNDPYYESGSLGGLQWDLSRINMPSAWDITKGVGVKVAVIDTGLSATLTDINSSNIIQGYDFVNKDRNPNDDHGHGSHVAGTIIAVANNGIGTAGIAPEAKILPVKVLSSDGYGSISDIISGAIYAYQRANIINMSITFGAANSVAQTVFSKIVNDGVPIIAAAGNENASTISYPAAYGTQISVAATDYNNVVTWYSNFGSGLDISAPGGESTDEVGAVNDENGDGYGDGILSQTLNDSTNPGPAAGFELYQGTSMAAPHVSGVAALLYAQGVRGSQHIKDALTSTATDLGSAGYDTTYGNGLLNALAALNITKSSVTNTVSRRSASYAQSIRVRGTIMPAQSAQVNIQTYDDVKGDWSTVATATSADNGAFGANIKLVRNSYIRADWNGTSSVLGQTSTERLVKVKPAISAKASARKVKKGRKVTIRGKVKPGHRGKIVAIQARLGDHWKTIARTKLNGHSVYNKELVFGATGLQKIRIYFRHSHHLPSASKTVQVLVI